MKLYQIYYDQSTMSKLDPGFIPLNNTDNLRPDWFEYIPIVNCLKDLNLDDNEYFGVFSPKFYEKTGMTSEDVKQILNKSNFDVVSFSPWYAHIALNKNIFLQAERTHPGSIKIFQNLLPVLGLNINVQECVMSSEQAIFCNYFVAKKWVWREWLQLSNKLFNIAESDKFSIGRKLRQLTSYNNKSGTPMKIFILERLISSWLSSKSIYAYFATDLNKCKLGYNLEGDELSIECLKVMDNLKKKYIKNGDNNLIKDYHELLNEFSFYVSR